MNQRLMYQSGFTATKVLSEVGIYGDRLQTPQLLKKAKGAQPYSSQSCNPRGENAFGSVTQPPKAIGQRAKLKQADKEFFVDLLHSAATKRDAKAYITRLQSPTKRKPSTQAPNEARSKVNLGNLFGRARAVDAKPVFAQHSIEEYGFDEQEVQHIALVKLSDTHTFSAPVYSGIAQTLSQLLRLAMAPCVVLDIQPTGSEDSRKQLTIEAERLASLLDLSNERGARVLDCIFKMSDCGRPEVSLPRLLHAPLERGQIPIVLPVAYSNSTQRLVPISPDDAVLALVADLSGYSVKVHDEADDARLSPHPLLPTEHSIVDRIIIINEDGGIPNPASPDGKHVFLNMEQEFTGLKDKIRDAESPITARHMSNLLLLKNALKVLPHSSSGLMTTPVEASNLNQIEHSDAGPTVGTRRQKNTLIHNLLTDRPAYSASLPKTRLARPLRDNLPSAVSTFVKRGMLIKMIPDPSIDPWSPGSARIRLTDQSIDLKRLVHLVDDSFNRKLDIDRYLERVNDNIAGVIIAGDYEGGAILTWETPPGADGHDISRQVPYLDKFAVLKKSQGAGGVADIVFNAMVRTCFPDGVCWRSRKNNPVNKWYFERSAGTWKIPDMNWTMFWTTPSITQEGQLFRDYELVCRGVQPTWADSKNSVN